MAPIYWPTPRWPGNGRPAWCGPIAASGPNALPGWVILPCAGAISVIIVMNSHAPQAAIDGSRMIAVSASFALSDTGEVRLEPVGSGWRWLASALWGEMLLSQQAGTWRRVKQCHKHGCDTTFYDRSKNNSGVWHNVKTCGNAENLRASRARRRDRERTAAGGLSPAPAAGAMPTGPSLASAAAG